MEKILMPEVVKQLGIFLDACMATDERADFVKDESLNNIKKLLNDKGFNSILDEYKKEFENKLIDTTDIMQQYQEAERNNIESYTEFIDNIKTCMIDYIKKVNVA